MPTEWQRDVFAHWGVEPAKLAVVPEAVDVRLFDPGAHPPLPLPTGRLVFGPARAANGGTVQKEHDSSARMKKFMQGLNWRRALLRLGGSGAASVVADEGADGSHVAAEHVAGQQQQQQQQQQQEPFVFLSR